MIQLPWHIDGPVTITVFLSIITVPLLYLRFLFNQSDSLFRHTIESLISKLYGRSVCETKSHYFSKYLMGMAIFFGLTALFTLSVSLGIIKNKETQPITIDDLNKFEKKMEEQGMKKRSNPALEEVKARWEKEHSKKS